MVTLADAHRDFEQADAFGEAMKSLAACLIQSVRLARINIGEWNLANHSHEFHCGLAPNSKANRHMSSVDFRPRFSVLR